jgi:DHA2 family multidrug resistance protein
MTAATGLYNVVRQVAGSIGIAIAATEVSRGTTSTFATITTHVTPYDLLSRQWLAHVTAAMQAAGASADVAAHQAIALLYASIQHQAAVIAYDRVMFYIAVLFIVALPLALLLRKGADTGEAPVLAE